MPRYTAKLSRNSAFLLSFPTHTSPSFQFWTYQKWSLYLLIPFLALTFLPSKPTSLLRWPSRTSLALEWLRLCLQCSGYRFSSWSGSWNPACLQPKSQNIKQKQDCNKFNKDFKNKINKITFPSHSSPFNISLLKFLLCVLSAASHTKSLPFSSAVSVPEACAHSLFDRFFLAFFSSILYILHVPWMYMISKVQPSSLLTL